MVEDSLDILKLQASGRPNKRIYQRRLLGFFSSAPLPLFKIKDYHVGGYLLFTVYCIRGARCVPRLMSPSMSRFAVAENASDTQAVYSARWKAKARRITTTATCTAVVVSAAVLYQNFSRANALSCIDGLQWMASQTSGPLLSAQSGICRCVGHLDTKVDPVSQVGISGIFNVARKRANSNFFTGVSAIEYGIDKKDRLNIDCRDFWWELRM